jgi:predicted RNase H-like nuclease
MGTFIGIDGIPRGWVAVYIDENGGRRFGHSSCLDSLLTAPHSRAMIDVPIGLPERGDRRCDREARERVGPRVFLGARWNLWNFPTFEDANAYYWYNGDKGIPLQLWCIREKLQEVNVAMTPQRQSRLKETHPELVFWRLNGEAPLANKKTADGRKQLTCLLKQQGFEHIETWLGQRRGTGIARDDLIDACACALAARGSTQRIPSNVPDRDRRGLRMEIRYRSSSAVFFARSFRIRKVGHAANSSCSFINRREPNMERGAGTSVCTRQAHCGGAGTAQDGRAAARRARHQPLVFFWHKRRIFLHWSDAPRKPHNIKGLISLGNSWISANNAGNP